MISSSRGMFNDRVFLTHRVRFHRYDNLSNTCECERMLNLKAHLKTSYLGIIIVVIIIIITHLMVSMNTATMQVFNTGGIISTCLAPTLRSFCLSTFSFLFFVLFKNFTLIALVWKKKKKKRKRTNEQYLTDIDTQH